MRCRGMAKANRKQKLKVYSTPIGFHDALVAAPSQKAALQAWGAGTNLFSQGSAHIVTDSRLTKVPLANPGQVVKVLRGTHSEQLAALSTLDRPKRKRASDPEVIPARAKSAKRKPSRTALNRREQALESLLARQKSQLDRVDEEMRRIEKRRSDLLRRHERACEKATERVEEERDNYQAAIDRYESS